MCMGAKKFLRCWFPFLQLLWPKALTANSRFGSGPALAKKNFRCLDKKLVMLPMVLSQKRNDSAFLILSIFAMVLHCGIRGEKKWSPGGDARRPARKETYMAPHIFVLSCRLSRPLLFRIPPGRPRRPPQRSPRGRRAGEWHSSQPQDTEGTDLLSSNPSCYLQSKKQKPQRQIAPMFFSLRTVPASAPWKSCFSC